MGLGGIFRFLIRRAAEALVVILLILFMPNVPPNAKYSKSFKVAPVKPFEGTLSLNEKLNDVEIWHKGDLHGPEAFADYNGQLYTTLHGGDVVKLIGNHLTPVVKFGRPCKGVHQEKVCGRPLGLIFDKIGTLYVADAYYGIFKVDVNSGQKEQLVSVDQEINGQKPKIPNSIAIASNGDLFWSDSSTEFTLEDGIFDMLADGSGRLIHYDAKTKKNIVLISDLHFANGVVLSDDEEFVLVCETARSRIHRYYLKGPKKGTHDIIIEGLPGLPDNLKSDGKGGFIVPLVVAVDADHPSIFQVLGPFPLIRKFVSRTLGIVQLAFATINRIYPNELAERGQHFVGHFTMGTFTFPKRVTVLRFSKSGEILDSLYCLNNKIAVISEAHIFKDTLYLGSPFNPYVARIPLSKIGWDNLASPEVKSIPTQAPTPKPTQAPTTTPKPTRAPTTTPKPTQAPTTTPKPTQAPTTTPKPTQAPKPTQPPTTTPKPTHATTTTPKSTQAPTTTPKPTQAPTTTATPTQAPTTTPKPVQVTPKPKEAPTVAAKPSTAPPTKQTTPPQTQPVKEQPKTVPVKESSNRKN